MVRCGKEVRAEDLVALSSVSVRAHPRRRSEMVTELVAGETLVPRERRGGWTLASVPGHRSSLDERGYPGWVAPEARLARAESWCPERVVARVNRAGLPLGALLRGAGEAAALPGGERVDLADEDTTPVGEPVQLSAGEVSSSLPGLPYRWGGTDSTTGMDCSGLVFRVMQLRGVSVPRDSADQMDLAPFKSQAGWEEARPGDLVFFGEETITHVGFYLGGGEYLSAHGADDTGCVTVRSMSDDPYRSFARYEAS